MVSHSGVFYRFEEVAFEPKPVRDAVPVLAGGESEAALRRAARYDGWISMPHTLETITPQVARLFRLAGRSVPVTAHAYGLGSPGEVGDWERLGVDRLIVRPFSRTRDAVAGLERFAREYGLPGRQAR